MQKIESREIAKNAVLSKHLKNRKAVQAKDVKPDSLGGAAVNEADLGQVPTANVANSSANADTLDNLNSSDFLRSDGPSTRTRSTGSMPIR